MTFSNLAQTQVINTDLDQPSHWPLSVLAFMNEIERRSKPRIYQPFPVKLRGVNTDGDHFKAETMLENLSSGGLYLRSPEQVEKDEDLFLVVEISTDELDAAPSFRLAVRGYVLRTELQSDGTYGLAIRIKQYRFLQ